MNKSIDNANTQDLRGKSLEEKTTDDTCLFLLYKNNDLYNFALSR